MTHTHEWGSWKEEKATCTENGEKTKECSSCHEVEREILPALNHSYKNGYCIRCDAIESITLIFDFRYIL